MSPTGFGVHAEQPEDSDAIRRVLTAAFPTADEADLVDDLRRNDRLALSLVATMAGAVVGYIAFSPVSIDGRVMGWGLAPLAVAPTHQRRGVGSGLIRQGLELAGKHGVAVIVVLGDPAYYSHFGFQPANRWGWTDEFGGGEAFQAVVNLKAGRPHADGLIRFAPEFSRFAVEPPTKPVL